MLRDGRADAALLYTPTDDVRGLDTETLLSERRSLCCLCPIPSHVR
ncbi:hypothetical protein SAMN04489713_126106 [Actinomadura madurae]|uniref:LysR substrate binding domain-containing protein n=2 Tax=Actinomadura madurae TaxID=1993 RepID=A0A1I5XEU4_9ACTN|nr:hypothetical protein SAMN04489713_126106 [Actinomadura madurae]